MVVDLSTEGIFGPDEDVFEEAGLGGREISEPEALVKVGVKVQGGPLEQVYRISKIQSRQNPEQQSCRPTILWHPILMIMVAEPASYGGRY